MTKLVNSIKGRSVLNAPFNGRKTTVADRCTCKIYNACRTNSLSVPIGPKSESKYIWTTPEHTSQSNRLDNSRIAHIKNLNLYKYIKWCYPIYNQIISTIAESGFIQAGSSNWLLVAFIIICSNSTRWSPPTRPERYNKPQWQKYHWKKIKLRTIILLLNEKRCPFHSKSL